MTLIDLVHLLMQYLVIPVVMWNWFLSQGLNAMQKEVAVLRAEAASRETARVQERENFSRQLDQILTALNNLNGRIDAMMKSN